jgi:hypothetical protein
MNTFATKKNAQTYSFTTKQQNYFTPDNRPSFASLVIWVAFGLIAFSAVVAVFIFVVPGA